MHATGGCYYFGWSGRSHADRWQIRKGNRQMGDANAKGVSIIAQRGYNETGKHVAMAESTSLGHQTSPHTMPEADVRTKESVQNCKSELDLLIV